MGKVLQEIRVLESAEEFLDYFSIDYDVHILNVARLHILKRFAEYVEQSGSEFDGLSDAQQFDLYRHYLEQAYQDFVYSTPAKEKVFKVLKKVAGQVQQRVYFEDFGRTHVPKS